MTVTTHALKTWPIYFDRSINGQKNFEARKNDRDFQTGDMVLLEEYDPDFKKYTGRWIRGRITYVLSGETFGIRPGFCVFGYETLEKGESYFDSN